MLSAAQNPFRSARIEALVFRLGAGDTWEALLARLAAQGGRGAVVGPKGSGKTTLMEELGRRYARDGRRVTWLRFHSQQRPRLHTAALPQDLGAHDVLLVDGAEQLNAAQWLALRWRARHAGVLLISVHAPARLPTVYTCATDAALLDALLYELAPDVANALEPQALLRASGGNVREAFRGLYDAVSRGELVNAQSWRHVDRKGLCTLERF